MTHLNRLPPARPFFLDTGRGRRFCLHHTPHIHHARGEAILYVHPFGEEMNLSRRMAALQARAFAAAGFGVLQIDLDGCGDSEGELAQATWGSWQRDLAAAAIWLLDHGYERLCVWGLRLGAMLALDFARATDMPIQRCILWHPVLAGRPYIAQLLRQYMVGALLAGAREGAGDARAALSRGETVEAGGYELSAQLVAQIESTDMTGLCAANFTLDWFELIPEAQAAVPAERMTIVREWTRRGVALHLHPIAGPRFWATQDISLCPALIDASTEALAETTT